MDLTRSTVEELAAEYREREPLFPVEEEQVSSLPDAFAAGTFGRRDAEWVVRWFFRRHLGAYPDKERRRIESAFEANDFEAVLGAIEDVVAADDVDPRVDRLTDLSGVDVRVASAFLAFVDPDSYVVVGEREWTALQAAGELDDPYPDPPTVADYEQYLGACRSVADRLDCDLWTLSRALWRFDADA